MCRSRFSILSIFLSITPVSYTHLDVYKRQAMSSVTAAAAVTVNPIASASSLTGTYTYYANGYDVNGAPLSVAGSVVLDGMGDITGGEQDYFDTFTGTIVTADPITAATGAYTIGDDGRGSITITPTTAPRCV